MQNKNIFILGMNEFNKQKLESLPQADFCTFHTLLTYEESHGSHEYRIKDIMEKAISRLESFDGSIDAVLGFWDFPVSIMQTILGKQFGTTAASPKSVVNCEHKFWSRKIQAEVIPESTPDFCAFDPFNDDALDNIHLSFPFWIKPIKSFAGHLGFRISSEADFIRAMEITRKRIDRFTKPFYELLTYADIPEIDEQEELNFCIAEGIISGHQCTVEGYAHDGEVHSHGIIDSHTFKDSSSFSHFSYPSVIPDGVKARMKEKTKKVMKAMGFDNSAFNVEFFWDEETDDIKLLEINPRISQSHADLFHKVDGLPNHKIILDIALGESPGLPDKNGPYNIAGKFFIRHFKNGTVEKAPGTDDLDKLHDAYPDVHVELLAKEGQELEDLDYHDSYSYKLAIVYLGGETEKEMQRKFKDVKNILPFEISGGTNA